MTSRRKKAFKALGSVSLFSSLSEGVGLWEWFLWCGGSSLSTLLVQLQKKEQSRGKGV
jgi:hypothetical protein